MENTTSYTGDLICPLTRELPIEPVAAEDGAVYEREAIEQHFQGKANVKSPITNEPMDTRLIPAQQLQNLIREMVKAGLIMGDLSGKVGMKRPTKRIRNNLGPLRSGRLCIGMAVAHGMYGLELKPVAC